MNVEFADRLEPLGILVGAFVVVLALARLAEMPWATSLTTTAAVIQVVGILAMFAVAAVLVFLSYTGDFSARDVVAGDETTDDE